MRKSNGLVTVLFVLCLLLVGATAGCGNVYLWGEGATACETSTMDAYLATQKASSDTCMPAWGKAYMEENFRQWRYFVRSARKDTNWGPKLPTEVQAQTTTAAGQ
ncbi:MAG: hypothetical protein NTV86_00205 [Planctomycetota bacterium]|nr:hypothetical protein [Planctomycetota bacterium]